MATEVIKLSPGGAEPRPQATKPRETARPASNGELHSLESERSVLGAILLAPDALHYVAPKLARDPDRFHRPAHRVIFAAMLEVSAIHGAVDLGLLVEHLRQSGGLKKVGGVEYLVNLGHSVPAAANLPAHVELLTLRHRQRMVEAAIVRAREAVKDASADPGQIVRQLASEAAALEEPQDGSGVEDLERGADTLLASIFGPSDMSGAITTGYADLDLEMGPWMPGDFILLGAKEKTGKSFFAMNLARNIAGQGRHVAFIGLEMTNKRNFLRLLALESGMETSRIRDGALTRHQQDEVLMAADRLRGLRLCLYDRCTKLEDIEATARQLKAAGKLDLLVVDHLQNVECKGPSKVDQTKAAATTLRRLANELGIVVLGINQFRASTGHKVDERPSRDWLFGGAEIKSLPTHILLLHRPDPAVSKCNVIIDASRDGESGGSVPLAFLPKIARFESWSSR